MRENTSMLASRSGCCCPLHSGSEVLLLRRAIMSKDAVVGFAATQQLFMRALIDLRGKFTFRQAIPQ
jgi:hypothetical protein